MASPDIKTIGGILGHVAIENGLNYSTFSDLLENPSNSGHIYKINAIFAANSSLSDKTFSIGINQGSGIEYIVYNLDLPYGATQIVSTKETYFYLEEGYKIQGQASSSGSVADGYVEDAFVFFDIDGDQEYDVGESFAYTDENGFYEIDNTPTGNYTIVAQGGIDVDSGEVIDVLYAPSDASMVTPLTTLSHFDPNFTIEGYENIDILNYDPIATLDANASSEEAATILSLGQQVMAVLGSVENSSSDTA